MEFGDVKSASGLEALDRHLADKSYIEGYVPTQVRKLSSSLRFLICFLVPG